MANIRIKITRIGQPHFGQIVTLDMEDYLVGVVSSEMSNAWPPHALMAQAVAARTYAMAHLRPGAAYDMDDTVKYQAYRYRKPGACPYVEQAVKATAGVVLRYGGKLISAVYSSNNGGRTISALSRWGSNVPYLISKPDPWDAATGLKRGGHGVGMSQRGAQWAATHGYTWRDILAFYYPGCALTETAENEPAPQTEPEPTKPSTYTVKKGDTLGKIGKAVHVAWRDLAKLNGIKGPLYIIRPGQVLKLK